MTSEKTLPAIQPSDDWLDRLPAGVVVIVDGWLRYANPAALRVMEADVAEDLVGHRVSKFVHPLDMHRVEARLRRAECDEGANPSTEFRAYSCKGRQRVLGMTSDHVQVEGRGGVLAAFLDMTERAPMEARLRETDDEFQRMMNTMQDVFYRTDAQGITQYVCPAVKNVLGYSAEEIIGLPAAAFYPDQSERDALVAAIREHGAVQDFPGRMQRKDGVIIDISISTQALLDERGNFAGVEGIWRDISERKAMERELERLARFDHLTGLPNRRSILDTLEHALQKRLDRREPSPLSVLLLDLDHFKRVNDSHGHAAGDRVLCEFVDVATAHSRGIDNFGRFGGEEFLMVLEKASDQDAYAVAERIRQAIEQTPMAQESGGISLTVSIGVAQWRDTEHRSADLLERVDHALYEAKRLGRNCVQIAAAVQ